MISMTVMTEENFRGQKKKHKMLQKSSNNLNFWIENVLVLGEKGAKFITIV